MDLTAVTIKDLIDFFALMIIVFNFGKWLLTFGNPIIELKKRVDRHDDLFSKDEEHLDKVDKAITNIDDGITVLGKAINELLRHEVSGNDIGELKAQQKALNDYFYGEK